MDMGSGSLVMHCDLMAEICIVFLDHSFLRQEGYLDEKGEVTAKGPVVHRVCYGGRVYLNAEVASGGQCRASNLAIRDHVGPNTGRGELQNGSSKTKGEMGSTVIGELNVGTLFGHDNEKRLYKELDNILKTPNRWEIHYMELTNGERVEVERAPQASRVTPLMRVDHLQLALDIRDGASPRRPHTRLPIPAGFGLARAGLPQVFHMEDQA